MSQASVTGQIGNPFEGLVSHPGEGNESESQYPADF